MKGFQRFPASAGMGQTSAILGRWMEKPCRLTARYLKSGQASCSAERPLWARLAEEAHPAWPDYLGGIPMAFERAAMRSFCPSRQPSASKGDAESVLTEDFVGEVAMMNDASVLRAFGCAWHRGLG